MQRHCGEQEVCRDAEGCSAVERTQEKREVGTGTGIIGMTSLEKPSLGCWPLS